VRRVIECLSGIFFGDEEQDDFDRLDNFAGVRISAIESAMEVSAGTSVGRVEGVLGKGWERESGN
jgi:hypothetical protein